MDPTIRGKFLPCSELFEQAPAEDSEIKDAHKRSKEWNTNYTAGRAGTPSLDERLRDAPDVRADTSEGLNALGMDIYAYPNRSRSCWLDLFPSGAESSVDRVSIRSLENISFRIGIPASVDRYKKAKSVNMNHFIPIDESHILELFPKVDPVLRRRLLQGLLSRRRALRYAQDHKEESAREAPCPQDEEENENDHETMPDISDSSFPPMPLMGQEGKPFECPCCFSMIEAKNRKEWKRHVSSDMRPYVCTFADCKQPDRLFESRDQWYFHELQYHRKTWVCISGCSKKFDSESAFKAHWSVAHWESGGVARAQDLGAHRSRRLEPGTPTSCPMCRDEIRDTGLIKQHIGRHQAELGLWPLRSMKYFDDEHGQGGNEENGEDGAETSDEKGKVPDNAAPSQDAAGSDSPPPGSAETLPSFDREDYTVGWICASKEGLDTAVACLDAKHKAVPRIPRGGHDYAFGEINGHHIVIGCADQSQNRQTSVANLAAMMRENFPGIRLGLSVGIGSAEREEEIRLGDVAVGSAGVLELGTDGVFRPAGPSALWPLRRAASDLSANFLTDGPTIGRDIQSIMSTKSQPWRDYYSRPDSSSDNHGPEVHRGWIASGAAMPTSADGHEAWEDTARVVCFEMEAAKLLVVSELADRFPVMLIRGICDYCDDTHQNEQWQPYATLSAAVYARTLLRHISPCEIAM